MRTLKAAYQALRDATVRAWNTFRLAVRTIRSGAYARGGILPTGPAYAHNTTGRTERVATPTRGRGSSRHRIGHSGQRRG
ncbi:hypothetical protein AB0I72_00545 [Nocardiopsis sp. NPDC049922]|uniref:hypothetical protein n=1 Tax=Nocardiopsis sp. NPDC049922 TaxID=3155157 RepID=UPI003408CD89